MPTAPREPNPQLGVWLRMPGGSVAAAVEEQSTVTADIAQNVSGVTTDMNQVSASIGGIAHGSVISCAGAIEVLWSSDDLAATAGGLKNDVVSFLDRLRA